MNGCNECLRDLQASISKYNDLPTSSQLTWERMEWARDELSDLQGRVGRSIALLSTLNSFLVKWVDPAAFVKDFHLTSCSSSSQAAIHSKLQKFMEDIRSGSREGSIVSADSLSLEEKATWRVIRKGLEGVGITPQLFEEHKDWIIRTLREAIESGTLQETPPWPSSQSIMEYPPLADAFEYPQVEPASNVEMSGLSSSLNNDAGAGPDSPNEIQRKDPLATQLWRFYIQTKKQLPNQKRMENLTLRMMAMNLRKRRQEEAL